MSICQHCCCTDLQKVRLASRGSPLSWDDLGRRLENMSAVGPDRGLLPREGPHCYSLSQVTRPWSGLSAAWTQSWRGWQPPPAPGLEAPLAPGLVVPCTQDRRHRVRAASWQPGLHTHALHVCPREHSRLLHACLGTLRRRTLERGWICYIRACCSPLPFFFWWKDFLFKKLNFLYPFPRNQGIRVKKEWLSHTP